MPIAPNEKLADTKGGEHERGNASRNYVREKQMTYATMLAQWNILL